MKIIIEAEAKEIADLIVALQGQHINQKIFKMTTHDTVRVKDLKKCIEDTLSTVFDSSKSLKSKCSGR